MIVGVMQVELIIHDAMNLKDKRRVVKSIKDRLDNSFNISIAEVDYQDRYRQAILGISMIGNESQFIQRNFDKLIEQIRNVRGASLVDYQIDYI